MTKQDIWFFFALLIIGCSVVLQSPSKREPHIEVPDTVFWDSVEPYTSIDTDTSEPTVCQIPTRWTRRTEEPIGPANHVEMCVSSEGGISVVLHTVYVIEDRVEVCGVVHRLLVESFDGSSVVLDPHGLVELHVVRCSTRPDFSVREVAPLWEIDWVRDLLGYAYDGASVRYVPMLAIPFDDAVYVSAWF